MTPTDQPEGEHPSAAHGAATAGTPPGPTPDSARPGQARWSFTARLSGTLALLLLGFGLGVALLVRQAMLQHDAETLQRLSHGLARHIIAHWPEITRVDRSEAEQAERQALLGMLMVVNPGVQVYVLDADGRVNAYIGEPGMVRQHQIDLAPVRAFLAGAALPLRGTDPMGGDTPRLFSVAMFAPRAIDSRPPGYLYIVLDSGAREAVAAQVGGHRVWPIAAVAVLASGLATLAVGLFSFRRMTQPLRALARRMHAYSRSGDPAAHPPAGDEVQAIGSAFAAMTGRIETQARLERDADAAHRETMASIAHDLRTPLTALHGHLEALGEPALAGAHPPARLLGAALAQSDKVRRLSQQLFELAALQSSDQVLQRERFSLDELVSDAVQKFELSAPQPPVQLCGPAPGRLELDADLQLVERALTNLIDNAVRHAGQAGPVRVSLRRQGPLAEVWVEDSGPGLPEALHDRLQQGRGLRDPPLRRPNGGIGGLGLAIAQRVAQLHGGSLLPLPGPQGGARLCLALPLAR